MSISLATWLKSLPQLLSTLVEGSQHATVIMGNEACDLDSGVSSLCLAFHRATSQNQNIIPLLNIPSLDFPLKTELVAALAEEGIDESSLFFRDISPSILNLQNFSLVLVDHNVLADGDKALENKVVEIVDHHVRETKLEQAVTIEPTGSCASLVLRTILSENPDFKDVSCLKLLRKTILLDTVCLRPEAKRTTPTDVAMVEKAEEILGKGAADREEVFDALVKEKARIDHLNVHQLLRRDLKVVTTSSESRIALSSVPLPCSSFLHLPDWPDHVEDFMTKGEFSCLIVLGLVLADQTVTRDLLVGGKADSIVEAVRDALEQSADPALNLQVSSSSPAGILGFRHYTQGNSAASRKQIMPIVKRRAVNL